MRRIIACVIVGLVTAIAIYHLRKVNRSTHTSTNLLVPGSAVECVKEKVVMYFPIPISIRVYE